jgi:hypothetical protein
MYYSVVGSEHIKIPVIMIPLSTARNLRRIGASVEDSPSSLNGMQQEEEMLSTGRMTLVVRPSVSALWSELDSLQDTRGWPADKRERRKLW